MSGSMFQNLVHDEPDKYPERMGKKWDRDEINKLLSSIKNKKSVQEIAEEHGRTVGGINSRRRACAVDYYFNDKKTIDEIIELTALSETDINEAIARRKYSLHIKEKVKSEKNGKKDTAEPTTQSKEIAELKNEIISLKKDVKEMLRLMNSLYEFETQ
jgi:hypothetical protein